MLLPFAADGTPDWPAFAAHVARTADAGLTPAVNMDTGYVHLLDDADRLRALDAARGVLAGRPFFAGAFVADRPGDRFDRDAYLRRAEPVLARGGTPVVFPSHGLGGLPDDDLVTAHAELGRHWDRFLAFELGPMFAPFGRIFSLAAYRGLLGVPQCVGAKHSSLRRVPEWERLALRDAVRPDFRVYTGNDLAIDMVMYGSDYLLGLSTFAPDLFARRDACWARGDPDFYELNDALQFLGEVAFRPPVPAYRHSAALFLQLRGWAASDRTPPGCPRRPDGERELLRQVGERLGVAMPGAV